MTRDMKRGDEPNTAAAEDALSPAPDDDAASGTHAGTRTRGPADEDAWTRRPALRLAVGVVLLLLLAWLLFRWFGAVGLLAVAVVAAVTLSRLLLDTVSELWQQLRAAAHAPVAGEHYAFNRVRIPVRDDGRHVWLDAHAVRRLLALKDRDDVLAARFAGRWRRGDADRRRGEGELWLRADAVVAHLASAPGRMDPARVRLRRYLEREVLFPAAIRRERGIAPNQRW